MVKTMSNTWTELNLDTLSDNIASIKAIVSPGSQIILVVKADAYGHGMVPVAECASRCGVGWFVVTQVDEAVKLRQSLADAEILIMGRVSSQAVDTVMAHRLIPVVVDEEHGKELAAAAEGAAQALRCHVKIDTGMGRLGIPWQLAAEVTEKLAGEDNLQVTGICTHFASSSSPDSSHADLQAQRFSDVIATCTANGFTIPFKHVANSGAFLRKSELDYDGVRSGILPYGYRPESRYGKSAQIAEKHHRQIDTKPFLHWKTRVIHLKDLPSGSPVGYDSTYTTATRTRIAILDVGYADGYRRQLSNKGTVLLGGRRVPVAGVVSMNFLAVDLGPDADVSVGDEAVLIGTQGNESLWADELADLCGTISYDMLTGIRTSEPLN